MAYSSTNPLSAVMDTGLVGAVWRYVSSHASSEIADVPAFFKGVGIGSRGLNGLGVKVGDSVLLVGSSISPIPGESVWTSVLSLTADQASTIASTGYSASYDATCGGFTVST